MGRFSVGNPTLQRFFSLHYLLPFVIAGVTVRMCGRCTSRGRTIRPASSPRQPVYGAVTPYATMKDRHAGRILCGLCVVRVLHTELSRPCGQLQSGQSGCKRPRISFRNGITCRSTPSGAIPDSCWACGDGLLHRRSPLSSRLDTAACGRQNTPALQAVFWVFVAYVSASAGLAPSRGRWLCDRVAYTDWHGTSSTSHWFYRCSDCSRVRCRCQFDTESVWEKASRRRARDHRRRRRPRGADETRESEDDATDPHHCRRVRYMIQFQLPLSCRRRGRESPKHSGASPVRSANRSRTIAAACASIARFASPATASPTCRFRNLAEPGGQGHHGAGARDRLRIQDQGWPERFQANVRA